MDNQKYSSKENKQAQKDLMIEHVLIELTKTFLLICMSVFLFFKGALLYGFLGGIFAYFYVFYGLFVKVPVEAKPYPYIGGSAFYAQEQRRFENDRRIKIENIKRSRKRSYHKTTISQSSMFYHDDDNSNFESTSSSSFLEYGGVNPATGLPMIGGVDVAGNPYGSDMSHDYEVFNSDSFDSLHNDDLEISSISDDDWSSASDDDWNS